MSKVSVIGSGQVGQVLADGFLKHGYDVMRGSRDPAKLADWKAGAGAKASTGTFAEAGAFGDMVVLAVKGLAAESAVQLCGPDALAGKTVIDATNPITDDPPKNGVLSYFTTHGESLMERLQRAAPKAHFVKAFSCVGNGVMVNPKYATRASMFICGNDPGAKDQVRGVLDKFGWDTEDMGSVEAARAIEPLCMLWCITGFTQNKWNHAFKLVRS